jgi:serine phosphatase RsbU (regulator of sigma subunit)
MSLFDREGRSIKFKAIGTLGFMLFIFILGYFIFLSILNKKNQLTESLQKRELIESVNAILLTKKDFYGKMVFDYAVFSWMIDFIQHPDKKIGEATISHPRNIGFDFIQVYNLDKKLVYNDHEKDIKDTLTLSNEVFDILYRKRKIDFFVRSKYGLIQIFGSTVHPSFDTERFTTPNGYIFFGKLWDNEYLKTLKKITRCSIELSQENKPLTNHTEEIGEISFTDYKSNKVAYINVTKINPFLENLELLNHYFNVFFIGFCLILLVVIYRNFSVLIISPLNKIEQALNFEETRFIEKFLKRKDEFGKIALLIQAFFKQKDELHSKIEELHEAQHSLSMLNTELTQQKKEFEDQNRVLQFLNREMQTQNDEIIATADGLELANKEITDSINYASFIQKAVLAPSYELSRIFSEHFVIYLPKNIVSGDFYWFKEMKNGERILAVADCTGHGLSGSLLSMLGISFLNQIMSQLDGELYTAATILESLKTFFIQSLHQGNELEYVQDGMHIALCIFDKDFRYMQYATAFHTICLVRKNRITGIPELSEYKGNRVPVGIYISDEQFINYTVELQPDDMLYMYSDGYADQFGGPLDKKFMPNRLRNLLLDNSQKPLADQRENVIHEFEKWKGNCEQTDDIIVVGIKIPR